MGSWLNLHTFLPYRDVRRLIYSYLDKYDKEVVEIAHGVRKSVSYGTFDHCVKKGYVSLVKGLYQKHFLQKKRALTVALLAMQNFNAELVMWLTEKIEKTMIRYNREIIFEVIAEGHDSMFKRLCLEYGFHRRVDVYLLLAQADNLKLAKWFHWKFPKHGFSYGIGPLVDVTTLEFMLWFEATFDTLQYLSNFMRAYVYDKFPELKRKRLKTSNVA